MRETRSLFKDPITVICGRLVFDIAVPRRTLECKIQAFESYNEYKLNISKEKSKHWQGSRIHFLAAGALIAGLARLSPGWLAEAEA